MKTNQDKINLANKFINPEHPTLAYILGLLWADGCVTIKDRRRDIRLTTTYPDANYFIPIFKSTGKWGVYSSKHVNHPTWKTTCQITTHNKKLAEFLYFKDYVSKSNKSADLILETIPEHLKHYWFLGLLDGDGCIIVDKKYFCYNVVFTSSYEQDWRYLEKLLKQLNVKYSIFRKETKNGNSSRVKVSNYSDCLKLLDFLYKDININKIGLLRKYEKYLQMKEIEEQNKFIGVCPVYKSSKWRAYTKEENGQKPKHLGHFDTKSEAIKAVEDFYKQKGGC